MRSTDCTTATRVNDADLSWPEAAWGLHYLGWTEDLNGVRLPLSIDNGSDDDMPKYLSLAAPDGLNLTGAWQSIPWGKVNSDPDHMVNLDNPGVDLGGRVYVATVQATILDAAEGDGRILLRYVEGNHGGPGGDWQVLETGRAVSMQAGAGNEYVALPVVQSATKGNKVRFQVQGPKGSSIDTAGLTCLYW